MKKITILMLLMLTYFNTEAQTRYLKDLVNGVGSATYNSDDFLEATDGYIYFVSKYVDNESEDRIYRTDGTTKNTELLRVFREVNSEIFQLNNNELIFSAAVQVSSTFIDRELFTYNLTDGTITNLDIVVSETSSSFPQNLTRLGKEIIFTADHFDNGTYKGRELYKIDENKNFGLVKELNPAPMQSGSSNPYNFSNAIDNNGNAILIFTANDGSGDKTWITDGTETGTYIVTPDNVGTPNEMGPYYQLNSKIIFSKRTASGGREPWVFDISDTNPQAVELKNIASIANSSDPEQFTLFNNQIYFSAADNGQFELWRTDGTETGTIQVDLDPTSPTGSNPKNIITVNDRLYMTANRGAAGRELVSVLPNNTVLVAANINQSTNGDSNPSDFLVDGTNIYFSATDGVIGRELYKYDAVNFNFNLVEDINTGAGSSSPQPQLVSNGILYHISDTDSDGRELFVTNLNATLTDITQLSTSRIGGDYSIIEWRNGDNDFIYHEVVTMTPGTDIKRIKSLNQKDVEYDSQNDTFEFIRVFFDGLNTEITYDFYVISYDSNGGFSISSLLNILTRSFICEGPTIFEASNTTPNSVTLSWSYDADFSSSFYFLRLYSEDGIMLTSSDNAATLVASGSENLSTFTHTFTNLSPQTTYRVIIFGACSGGSYASNPLQNLISFTTNSTLSDEEFTQDSISIFPNPANNSITIKDTKSEILKIEIHDITGKKVNQFKGSTDGNYAVSELSNGIYLLKVYSVNGTSVTKKLIKD